MSFEQIWAGAFENAEMSPSPELWIRLDSHLANADATRSKGRLLFFQLLAAASFSLAMGIGIYSYLGDGSTPTVADSRPTVTGSGGEGSSTKSQESVSEPAQTVTGSSTITSAGEQIAKSASGSTLVDPKEPASASGDATLLVDVDSESDLVSPVPASADLSEVETSEMVTSSHSAEAGGLARLLSKEPGLVSDMELEDITVYRVPSNYIKEKNAFDPVMWAGVDFSSGMFDPNYGRPGGGFGFGAADAAPTTSISDNGSNFGTEARTVGEFAAQDPVGSGAVSIQTDPGVAFSTGLSFGARIAPRWILQSGLNYGNYQSTSQTSAYVESGDQRIPLTASNVNSESLANSQVIFDSEFAINSSYQFLSVPVKAGYVLVDRRFSMALIGGMTSDFLLNNKISADNYGDSNVGSGDTDPFRSVYLSGLTGLGLGYSFQQNYLITLEPSYRLALSSLTKPDSFFRSSPNMFTISLGVRYNFK